MKSSPAQLTKDAAAVALAKVIAEPAKYVWEWDKLGPRLPRDVDRALLHRALVATSKDRGWIAAAELPEFCDDAIVRLGEQLERKQAGWAFVMVALRGGRGDRHRRLRHLLAFEDWIEMAGGGLTRRAARALIAQMPEIVDAARAAYAIDIDERLSCFLPILAVDGTPDSLDLLLPLFERVLAKPTLELDWVRRDIAPLLVDSKPGRAFVERFDAALAARGAQSPARDFVKRLGMAEPPPVVKITLTFKGPRGATVYALKIDSTDPRWLCGRRDAKWQWRQLAVRAVAKQVPPTAERFVLMVSRGVDRALVERWAISLLPAAARAKLAAKQAIPPRRTRAASKRGAARASKRDDATAASKHAKQPPRRPPSASRTSKPAARGSTRRDATAASTRAKSSLAQPRTPTGTTRTSRTSGTAKPSRASKPASRVAAMMLGR